VKLWREHSKSPALGRSLSEEALARDAPPQGNAATVLTSVRRAKSDNTFNFGPCGPPGVP
jgi:hypothetical protein